MTHLSPEKLVEVRSEELLAIFTAFLVLPLIVTSLRVLSRRITNLSLWWDDWLLIVASPVSITHFVFETQALRYGMGEHQERLRAPQIERYMIYLYACQLYYPIVVTLVKCSILCLYLRLFSINRTFVKLCHGMIALSTLWGIAVLLVTIFQCYPIEAVWNGTWKQARCIDLPRFLTCSTLPSLLLDLVVVGLPMPLIWRLRLSKPRKIGVCATFCLAFITTLVGVQRARVAGEVDMDDLTWSVARVGIYSVVEANAGITLASLPVLAPLIRLAVGRRPVSTEVASVPLRSRISCRGLQSGTHNGSWLTMRTDTDGRESPHQVDATAKRDVARPRTQSLRFGEIRVTREIDVVVTRRD